RRLGAGQGRPLLAGDVAGAVARLDAERRPLYADVADIIVDVDHLSADEVAARIEAELPDAAS
ncbi:MAG: shikimate kinase, partial [Actinomycetota bacterium]|nr:shikimate kinase [Actinomycetota bacterium]